MTATIAEHSNILVYRLAQLLIKLNQGERLDPQALAEEFGVNQRTIQRDLNERLVYLPLEKLTAATTSIQHLWARSARTTWSTLPAWLVCAACFRRCQ